MTEKEKRLIWICSGGIVIFLCKVFFYYFNHNFDIRFIDCFVPSYLSPFGVILVFSVIGLIVTLIAHFIRSRHPQKKKGITKGYTISFILSFIPWLLILANAIYSSNRDDYFWRNMIDIFILSIAIFSIIPVIPFCLFWEILYIVKRIKAKKSA